MSVNEASRHRLHEAVRSVLGDDAAVTLMEMLPPVGWADVTTKRDLDQLEDRIDTRLDHLEERFDLKLDRWAAQIQNRMTLRFTGIAVAMVAATGALSALG